MISLDLWKGIAIGCILALLIILAIVHLAGNANAKKAKAAGDRNFAELQKRNDIGNHQISALRMIDITLRDQARIAADMRDFLKSVHSDPTKDNEAELNRTRDERNGLMASAEWLLESLNIPDSNCSCHQVAPCHDCVEYGGLREAVKSTQAALGKVAGRAE